MKYIYFVFLLILSMPLNLRSEDKKTNPIDEEDAARISYYKDIYFIFGEPDTKVQLSFKYRFTRLLDIFLGYSQIMFWDLDKESSPFKDVNYNPDVFYRWRMTNTIFLKGFVIGFCEHMSNGRDGLDSRSYNSSYITLILGADYKSWKIRYETKFYALYSLDYTNPDLLEYMGFWSTKIALSNIINDFLDRATIYFRIQPGGKYSNKIFQGSQELGFIFRLGAGRFYPSIYFQIYNGYMESLINYSVSSTSYRVGLLF